MRHAPADGSCDPALPDAAFTERHAMAVRRAYPAAIVEFAGPLSVQVRDTKLDTTSFLDNADADYRPVREDIDEPIWRPIPSLRDMQAMGDRSSDPFLDRLCTRRDGWLSAREP